jgi:hypothetical protein
LPFSRTRFACATPGTAVLIPERSHHVYALAYRANGISTTSHETAEIVDGTLIHMSGQNNGRCVQLWQQRSS